jgi:hypothetical protein
MTDLAHTNGDTTTSESEPQADLLGNIFYWAIVLCAVLALLLLLTVVALGVAWVFHLLIGLFP